MHKRRRRRASYQRRKRHRAKRLVGLCVLLVLGVSAWVVLTRSALTTHIVRTVLSDALAVDARVDDAIVRIDGRVEVSGVAMRVPGAGETLGDTASRFFEADRVLVDVDWSSLLTGGDALQSVHLEGAILRLSVSAETGRLNIAGLSLLTDARRASDSELKLPEVSIVDAAVEVGEHALAGVEGGYNELRKIPASGRLVATRAQSGAGYDLSILQDRSSSATSGAPQRPIAIVGSITSEGELQARLAGLSFADWPGQAVPRRARGVYQALELEGELGETVLSVAPDGAVSAELGLLGVSLTLPFEAQREGEPVPVRMTETRGRIRFAGGSMSVSATGQVQGQSYGLELDTQGLERTSPFVATLTSSLRLERDMDLLLFIPPSALDPLDMFIDPRALVEAELRVSRTEAGGDVDVRGRLLLSEGSASYRSYPYRFTDLTAEVTFTRSRLDIVSVAGSHPSGATISARGTFAPLGPTSAVDLRINVRGAPTDDDLLAGLNPGRRELVDTLFSRARYDELLAEGLVVTPEQEAERRLRWESLREQLAAWPAGGIADAERARLESRAESLRESLQTPVFELGGMVDVDLHLRRALGLENTWVRDITVRLPRAGVVVQQFPLPMVASGVELRIGEDEAELVEGFFGGLTGGYAEVEAELAMGDGGSEPRPRVRVHAFDVPIDARLVAAIPGYRGAEPGQPGTLRRMFDGLAPTGFVECEADIGPREGARESAVAGTQGEDFDLGFDARAVVRDASARPGAGDLVIEQINGEISVREDRLSIDLTASAGRIDGALAPVRLSTLLEYPGGRFWWTPDTAFGRLPEGQEGPALPGARLRVGASAEGMDLAAPLELAAGVFSEDAGERLARLRAERRPEGRLSLRGGLSGFLGGPAPAWIEVSDIERADFDLAGQRVRVRDARGSIRLDGAADPFLVADGFDGAVALGADAVFNPRTRLAADGRIALVRTGDVPADLARRAPALWRDRIDITLTGVEIEAPLVGSLVRAGLGDQGGRAYDALNPAGELVATLTLGADATGEAAPFEGSDESTEALRPPPLVATGEIRPRRFAFDASGGRVDLRDMDGRIVVTPQRGEVIGLTAFGEGLRVRADGAWTVSPDGAIGIDLSGTMRGSGVPADVLRVLPEGVRTAIVESELSIEEELRVDDMALRLERPAGGGAWAFDGEGSMAFGGLSATAGVELAEGAGRVGLRVFGESAGEGLGEGRGKGRGEVHAQGDVELDRGRVAGLRLSGVTGSFERTPAGAIALTDVAGFCHGGRLVADVGVDETGYRVDAMLAGARASGVFADLGVPAPGGDAGGGSGDADRAWDLGDDRSRGVMDASLSLVGRADDVASRVGRGEVTVVGGSVVELPLLINLIEFSNLQLPVADRLDLARASFSVVGDRVDFEGIGAMSSSVEVFGYGSMLWDRKAVDLRFNSRAVNRLPFLSPLLEGIRNELISTRVGGTVGDLSFQTEGFSGTKRALGELFGAEPSEGDRRLAEVESRAREERARLRRTTQRADERERAPAAPREPTINDASPGAAERNESE
ncbi:MAG: hypothetical protein AAFP26_01190 [Planctomycetota bacterium]